MNNDLISREALIKWIDDSVSQYGHTYSTDMLNMWGLFKDYLINNAPTVEPTFGLFKEMLCAECEKRPQGEWINIGFMVCKCNKCGQQFHELEENNYCPNCGVKMKGGAE